MLFAPKLTRCTKLKSIMLLFIKRTPHFAGESLVVSEVPISR